MENNHSDNYTPSEEKNHVDSIMKNVTKKYSPKQILQGVVFPWILVAFLLLGIGIYFFYQTKNSVSYPYMHSLIYHYDRHPWTIWPDWHIDNNRYWMDIEDRIQSLQNQHKNLLQEIKNSSQILPSNRYYQGTKIINNDIFSYSLDMNEKNLSGSIYSSKSGSLDDLAKKIQSFGIKLKRIDNQYFFSGTIDNIQNILNLLGV